MKINIQAKRSALMMAFLSIALLAMSFLQEPHHITVFLAGDSTMSDKVKGAGPETGWGMPFYAFFDSTVTVNNKARNGRSTKSFIAEGLWKSITDSLHAGDYVLIQFGHNDEVPTKAVYTSEADYQANLERMISETRAKGGSPILITPVARRKFNSDGQIQGTHDVYSAIVCKVATEQQTPLIDLDKDSQALIQQYGPEDSKMLFNYLQPGQNPNYPDGRSDDTHFNELGARKMAEIVLHDIKSLNLELANRIVVSHLAMPKK